MRYVFTVVFGALAVMALYFALFCKAEFHYLTATMTGVMAFVSWKAD